MQFEATDLMEFIALWKEEFGEAISLEEARHRAAQIMELYLALATRPHGASRIHDASTNDTP